MIVLCINDCKSSSCYIITIFPRVSNLGYNYLNYYGQRRLEITTVANNNFYIYAK